jgi:SAM-dependent methyltransferase
MNCPLCSSPQTQVLWRNTQFCVAECRNCVQVFTDPRGYGASSSGWFEGSYFDKYARYEDVYRCLFEHIVTRIESRGLPARTKVDSFRGRLLDVGCGIGTFAGCAERRGWSVVGIDTSRMAIQRARERNPGIEFSHGHLEGLAEKAFDAITLLDVLMYVESPSAFLDCVRQLLSIGGILAVKAINRPATFIRAVNLLLMPTRQRGQGLLYLPNSRYHFSPCTLARLVEPHGFRLLAWENLPNVPLQLRWAELAGVRDAYVRALGEILTLTLTRRSHFLALFRAT